LERPEVADFISLFVFIGDYRAEDIIEALRTVRLN